MACVGQLAWTANGQLFGGTTTSAASAAVAAATSSVSLLTSLNGLMAATNGPQQTQTSLNEATTLLQSVNGALTFAQWLEPTSALLGPGLLPGSSPILPGELPLPPGLAQTATGTSSSSTLKSVTTSHRLPVLICAVVVQYTITFWVSDAQAPLINAVDVHYQIKYKGQAGVSSVRTAAMQRASTNTFKFTDLVIDSSQGTASVIYTFTYTLSGQGLQTTQTFQYTPGSSAAPTAVGGLQSAGINSSVVANGQATSGRILPGSLFPTGGPIPTQSSSPRIGSFGALSSDSSPVFCCFPVFSTYPSGIGVLGGFVSFARGIPSQGSDRQGWIRDRIRDSVHGQGHQRGRCALHTWRCHYRSHGTSDCPNEHSMGVARRDDWVHPNAVVFLHLWY